MSIKTQSEKIHCLVVDDDLRIRDLLSRYLQKNDCFVITAKDGEMALDIMQRARFDIVILDVMMPKMDGFTVAKKIGEQSKPTPILLLTAKDTAEDRIQGLELGADDYLTKPFEPKELLLRIQSILRRVRVKATSQSINFGPYVYDNKCILYKGDQRIDLSASEAGLLSVLMTHMGDVCERDTLCEALDIDPETRTVDVQVNRLRQKLEADPKNPRYIVTVRGRGYALYDR